MEKEQCVSVKTLTRIQQQAVLALELKQIVFTGVVPFLSLRMTKSPTREFGKYKSQNDFIFFDH